MIFRLLILVGSLGASMLTKAQSIPVPAQTTSVQSTLPPPTQILIQRQISPAPTAPPTSATNGYYISEKYITIPGFTNEHATKHDETITIAIPTCSQTIIPDKNGYLPPGTCGAKYKYYPSFNAALVTAILFGILTAGHIALAVMYRTSFCWVVIMGTLWEALGFALRTASTKQQQNSGLVLVSQILVLLVPLWINAFIYILLARLVYYISPKHSVFHIPAQLLSVMFVALDFITFVVQLAGGMMAGPTAPVEEQMKGIHIYMGGIGLQQFFIVIFLGIAVKFQLEMRQLEKIHAGDGSWKKLLWAVYAGLGFITVSASYRIIHATSTF